jgi:hypothetical protein
MIALLRCLGSLEKQAYKELPSNKNRLTKNPLRNQWVFLLYCMSNITTAFNNRTFVFPKADFASESQQDLIKLIIAKHGELCINKISLIDENDQYDSFLVEVTNITLCVKISFDQIPIFYEYMVLDGIVDLHISPQVIDRGEIEFGKTVYYTIQSYEHSNNLTEIGVSSLLSNDNNHFNDILKRLHTYIPPENVFEHLDDTESYLIYHKTNFEEVIKYVDANEVEDYNSIKILYNHVYDEMMRYYYANKNFLLLKSLVHGNLDASTIISNNFLFKFINFENSFIGSPLFDICNLVFEVQMSGLNEFDFVTKKIKDYGLVNNRLKASQILREYKICKYIWNRKKFLDLINEYIKEVIILNKSRGMKIVKLCNYFSSHFYRFSDIEAFQISKDILVQKFQNLIENS